MSDSSTPYSLMTTMSSGRILHESWYNFTHAAVERYSSSVALYQLAIDTLLDLKPNTGEAVTMFKRRCRNAALAVINEALTAGSIEGIAFKGAAQDWFDSVEVTPYGSFVRRDLVIGLGEGVASKVYDNYVVGHDIALSSVNVSCLPVGVPFGRPTTFSIEDFCTGLNNTLHAAVCEMGAAKAYLLSAVSDIKDRLSVVRDTVSTYFRDAYTDYSGKLNNVISKISQIRDLGTYLREMYVSSGLSQLHQSDIQYSDDYKYTGASPAGAFAAQILKDRAVTTLQDLGTVISAVMALISKGLVGAVSKGVSWIKRTYVDPHDLVESNGDDSPTVTAFHATKSYTTYKPDGFVRGLSWYNTAKRNAFRQLCAGSIKFDLLSCEVIIVPSSNLGLSDRVRDVLFPVDDQPYVLNDDMEWVKCEDDIWFNLMTYYKLTRGLTPISTGAYNSSIAESDKNQLLKEIVSPYYSSWNDDLGWAANCVNAWTTIYPGVPVPTLPGGSDYDMSYIIYTYFHDFNVVGAPSTADFNVKFKPIKYEHANQLLTWVGLVDPQQVKCYSIRADLVRCCFDQWAEIPDLYQDVNSDLGNEVACYNAFIAGMKISSIAFAAMRTMAENEGYLDPVGHGDLEFQTYLRFNSWRLNINDAVNAHLAVIEDNSDTWPVFAENSSQGPTIRNRNFVGACTGSYFKWSNGRIDPDVFDWSDLFYAIGLVGAAGSETYIPFLSSKDLDWYPSRYTIKTDMQNALDWADAMSTTLVIAILAAIAISASVILKRGFRRASVTAEAMRYQLEDRIRSGTVSTADWRTWRTAVRKEKLLGLLSGNLTTSVSSGTNSGNSLLSSFLSSDRASASQFEGVNAHIDAIPATDLTPVIDLIR